MGVSVDLSDMVRGYRVQFLNRVFVLDLYILRFEGFDVILGTDC